MYFSFETVFAFGIKTLDNVRFKMCIIYKQQFSVPTSGKRMAKMITN